jgi:predicted DNA binding CopG/RHH family protein
MKKRKQDALDIKLDSYEQEISDAIDQTLDKGELKRAGGLAKKLAFSKEAAANFLRKNERITLRLSSGDLARLKQKAAHKGLPYQTFIASVLHEYAAGHFMEVV